MTRILVIIALLFALLILIQGYERYLAFIAK